MDMERPEGIGQILPTFHGQSAQILAYAAARGIVTPEEIKRDLSIPRSTVYKLLAQFVDEGLVVKEKDGNANRFSVPDFEFIIKNTAFIAEIKVTPRNVLAFDAIDTNVGKAFTEQRGPEKFARFVELYGDYARGNTTAQIIARELGVTRFEVELLLSSIKSVNPGVVVHERARRRQ